MRKVRGSIPLTSKFFWSHDYKGDSLAGGGILLIGSGDGRGYYFIYFAYKFRIFKVDDEIRFSVPIRRYHILYGTTYSP